MDSKAIRKSIIEIIHRGGASHVASSFSMVEILVALYSLVDIKKIQSHSEDRDRIIVSKGHSAAALYAVMEKVGLLSSEELNTYHTNGSLLSGHVSHFVRGVEHSTGALGHGLSVAVGMCIGLQTAGHGDSRVYAVVGDGEMHEGSNWEALMFAGHRKLSRLCMLIDNNCISGIGQTQACCNVDQYPNALRSFGFEVKEVDGHDQCAIVDAIKQLNNTGRPGAVICHTIKGKGVSFMEQNNVWHYRPINAETREKALAELSHT